MTGGRPERSRSPRPAIPTWAYRFRQRITVGRETPTIDAIAVFGTPWAANNTIRARWAKPASTVEDRIKELSSGSSPVRSNIGAATDIPHCPKTVLSSHLRHATLATVTVTRSGRMSPSASDYALPFCMTTCYRIVIQIRLVPEVEVIQKVGGHGTRCDALRSRSGGEWKALHQRGRYRPHTDPGGHVHPVRDHLRDGGARACALDCDQHGTRCDLQTPDRRWAKSSTA